MSFDVDIPQRTRRNYQGRKCKSTVNTVRTNYVNVGNIYIEDICVILIKILYTKIIFKHLNNNDSILNL